MARSTDRAYRLLVERTYVSDIFLSYRSNDEPYVVAEMYTTLAERFEDDRVFLDWRSMPPGTIYPHRIRSAVKRAKVLLAIIGPRWLAVSGASGLRTIYDPRDWVRQELAIAFEYDVPVVPVLLDGGRLPTVAELPFAVSKLALCQAFSLRRREFRTDLSVLAEELARFVPDLFQPRATAPPQSSEPPRDKLTQHNEATVGGVIYANQGGNMTVNRHKKR